MTRYDVMLIRYLEWYKLKAEKDLWEPKERTVEEVTVLPIIRPIRTKGRDVWVVSAMFIVEENKSILQAVFVDDLLDVLTQWYDGSLWIIVEEGKVKA